MSRLVLLGRSEGYAAILIDIAHAAGGFDDYLIVRNQTPEDPAPILRPDGAPVAEVGWDDWSPQPGDRFALGVGRPASRRAVFAAFQARHALREDDFPALVHPTAVVGLHTRLGPGVVVDVGARVGPMATIGAHALVRAGAYVGHHGSVGAFVLLTPSTSVGGYCTLGEGAEIGIGATVIDRISLGERCRVGAGSVVVKDIPADVVAYGVPARVVRENAG